MKRGILAIALASVGVAAHAVDFRVSITNMAPSNGTYLTPMWFGFHDGSFDTFSVGSAASMGLERIAEDGNPSVIGADFMASGAGSGSGVLSGIGPIAPGQSTSMIITIDENDPRSNYFSFLSMVIPSNDAFIGNENPLAHRVINENGEFVGADFIVLGSQCSMLAPRSMTKSR
ncbi:MAG: spondin domain-containing protein [Fimbriimonadaceae bacterium]